MYIRPDPARDRYSADMSSCSGSVLFFRFALIVSLLRQWCDEGEWQVNYDRTAVKHLLSKCLRKNRLWRRVVRKSHSSRPILFLIGILLLSGDIELNPGPKTMRGADKGISWLWNVVCDYNTP